MFTSLSKVTYRVPDLAKAKEWYRKALEKDPVYDTPFVVYFTIGSVSLILMPNRNPDSGSNENSIAVWEVENIQAAYKRLLELGATQHSEISTFGKSQNAGVIDPFGNIIGITCKNNDATEQAVENQPSQSALTVTLCRALSFKEEAEANRGPDHLAEIFLLDETQKTILDFAAREYVKKMITDELYGFIFARTLWLDQIFVKALSENIPQIVFLGAGYDSRSYRFSEKIKNTRIFEVDVPITQNRKLQKLQQAGIRPHQQLTYVATNFKDDSLPDMLVNAGFTKTKTTLFIWEGVCYYLTEEAVRSTLQAVKIIAHQGSAICFDYMNAKRESVYAGEPFLFFLEHDRMEAFVTENGFEIGDHFSKSEIENLFLTTVKDRTITKSLQQLGFIRAIVK